MTSTDNAAPLTASFNLLILLLLLLLLLLLHVFAACRCPSSWLQPAAHHQQTWQ
jgi:hypothetical protein